MNVRVLTENYPELMLITFIFLKIYLRFLLVILYLL